MYKKPSQYKTPLQLIKDTTSCLSLGSKRTQNGKTAPLPEIYKLGIVRHYNSLKAGSYSFLPAFTHKHLDDNATGEMQYYFSGAHEAAKHNALIMIDVDCHEGQSVSHAQAAIEYIQREIPEFATLFIEPSSRGYHGYFFLVKHKQSAKELNEACKQLQSWFNHEITPQFNISMIEVKGRIPELEWGKAKHELKTLKCGGLARLPMGIKSRFDEFKNSSLISSASINAITERTFEKHVFQNDEPIVIKPKRELKGSFACKHITESMIAGLHWNGAYGRVASHLMNGAKSVKLAHRRKLTAEFLSVVVMLSHFFTLNMNDDGTMPTARFRAMWNSLVEAGDISVAWNENEFAAARNLMTDKGMIDWQSNRYWFNDGGGRAMQWKLNNKLVGQLDSEINNTKDERASLFSTTFNESLSLITESWSGEVIRPECINLMPVRAKDYENLAYTIMEMVA